MQKKNLKWFALIFSAASWKLAIAEKQVLLAQVINISETSHSRNIWMYEGENKEEKATTALHLKRQATDLVQYFKETRNTKVEAWLTFCMAVFAQLLL